MKSNEKWQSKIHMKDITHSKKRTKRVTPKKIEENLHQNRQKTQKSSEMNTKTSGN